jgi:hypothetical protein
VGIGLQPVYNKNLWWTLYFMIFVIVFVFFLLNLFVGVVVSTFNTEKERVGKNFLLTSTQKEWLSMKVMLLNTKPVIKKMLVTSNPIRKFCFKVVLHPAFDWIILAFILMNTIVLTLDWYLIPDSISYIVSILNIIFTAIFTIEAILKIIALGIPYFK